MSDHNFEFEYPAQAFLRALTTLSTLLRKAEEHVREHRIEPSALLTARLFPDMFPLTKQVQTLCDTARRVVSRLAGIQPPSVEDSETTFDELQARISETAKFVSAHAPAALTGAITRSIEFKMQGTRTLPASQYLARFAIPNLYFHLATAYNIMRHNGVTLGKMDFLGNLTSPLGD